MSEVKPKKRVVSKNQTMIPLETYIRRIVKEREGKDVGCTGDAMQVLNHLCNAIFERILENARNVASRAGRVTLSASDIKYAVSVVFPEELAKHTQTEMDNAITKYNSSRS